jgi:hypothetical protein
MMLATALSLYGSTAIVGFTSLRGVYIAPCFSSGNDQMRIGIFGGAIVIFANLLLVCAVILGEVRVSTVLLCLNILIGGVFDCYSIPLSHPFIHLFVYLQVEDYKYDDDRDQNGMEPYRVERIATVLAVTCMFLSALYTIFAILLFLCHASDDIHHSSEGNENHNIHHDTGNMNHTNPLVTVTTAGDQRHNSNIHHNSPGFITMENSS